MAAIEAGSRQNPAVIFLHGLGTGARAWQPQLDSLSDRFHVLALYQPGYGTAPGPFTLDRAVDAVDGAMQQHGLARAHLCGLSLGTMVALTLALRDPGSVASLSLCGGFARLTEEMRAVALSGVSEIRGMPDDEARTAISQPVPEAYREETLRDLAGVSGDHLATIMERVAGFDVADRLADLAIPTLVLCGERDEVNLPFCREMAAMIAGARFEIIPDAGHVANLDNPEAFTAVLEEFLGETERK